MFNSIEQVLPKLNVLEQGYKHGVQEPNRNKNNDTIERDIIVPLNRNQQFYNIEINSFFYIYL